MRQDAKRRVARVHRLLTAHASETFFLPSGVAALHRLTLTGSDLGTEDAWRAYTGWHERVHFSQLMTSPLVCEHGWMVASSARAAARQRATGKDTPESLAKLRARYDATNADCRKPGARGYTTLDVIETQAVAQGLARAFGGDVDRLGWMANYLYTEHQGAPHYIRVVNDAIRDLGSEGAALTLLPRLCVVALQFAQPADVLAGMLERVVRESAGEALCAADALDTWSWALGNPRLLSTSLRERGLLNGLGWLELFNPSFDEFEQFGPEDRLRLMMSESVGGVDPFNVFRPVLLYDDGTVVLPRGYPPDLGELENEERDLWLSITTEIIDGLTVLEHAAERE